MKMKTIFILKNKNALYRRLENMKRRMIMAMAAMYTVSCMAGCGSAVNADAEQPQGTSGVEEGAQAGASADPIQVVTTIFPEYDWVKTILGDQTANAEITMLLDNGVDLHSFEPTAEDIMKISDCDMFVYVGGESDEWVTDVLRAADNKDMVVINLLDVLGERVKEEEIVEGKNMITIMSMNMNMNMSTVMRREKYPKTEPFPTMKENGSRCIRL